MHIRKKTGKGFLDSLQERNSVKTIGIVAGSRGDGVTTLSIAMANYLAEIMSMKTAIIECNEAKALELMRDTLVDGGDYEDSFVIGKVTYFFNIDINSFMAKDINDYEYVIIDFGNCFRNYQLNQSKLKYKIILGSVMPYKSGYHKRILEMTGNSGLGGECLHLLSGDEKSVKEYSAANKINGMPAPVIVNPYIIDNKLTNFFQILF